jgi:tRNA threonylcarbamoyladenosine modification (KEOPS) complex  Pcc1 subunit
LKSSRQIESKSTLNNPANETAKTKSTKSKSTPSKSPGKSEEKRLDNEKLDEIYEMIRTVMAKLDTLDEIKNRIVCVEQDFKQMKSSLEFAHAEVQDLKEQIGNAKNSEEENRNRIVELEEAQLIEANRCLHESVIDLKAPSMRDNLLFFNVEEEEKENTDEKIFQILEEKLEIPDARNKIKIDRTHRVGRKRNAQRKQRAIVVKFNYFRDREFIRQNARKLRGTRIGIAEQFPEEIEKIRQTLYPEMKKAKAAKQRVRMVRDKLFINGVEFKPQAH